MSKKEDNFDMKVRLAAEEKLRLTDPGYAALVDYIKSEDTPVSLTSDEALAKLLSLRGLN